MQWQGQPGETRDALLAEVWRRIPSWTRGDRKTIENDIYDLATRGAIRHVAPGPPAPKTAAEVEYEQAIAKIADGTAAARAHWRIQGGCP